MRSFFRTVAACAAISLLAFTAEPSDPKGAAAKDDPIADAMLAYELAKSEFHGWVELGSARTILNDAPAEESKGNHAKAEKIRTLVRQRYRDITTLYPESQAASDARELLLGKSPPRRPAPPRPKLPPGVKASEEDLRPKLAAESASTAKVAAATTAAAAGPTPSNGKTVYVRGYYRADGTYVAPHYRAAPKR
jgi:hypothetical protein